MAAAYRASLAKLRALASSSNSSSTARFACRRISQLANGNRNPDFTCDRIVPNHHQLLQLEIEKLKSDIEILIEKLESDIEISIEKHGTSNVEMMHMELRNEINNLSRDLKAQLKEAEYDVKAELEASNAIKFGISTFALGSLMITLFIASEMKKSHEKKMYK